MKRHILSFGMVAVAAGFLLIAADSSYGQNRYYKNRRSSAVREYNRDIRDAKRDYRRDIRDGDNPYEARRDYYEDVREAQREYQRNVTRTQNGWYFYDRGRRYYRPASVWNYRNGYFYRRY